MTLGVTELALARTSEVGDLGVALGHAGVGVHEPGGPAVQTLLGSRPEARLLPTHQRTLPVTNTALLPYTHAVSVIQTQ